MDQLPPWRVQLVGRVSSDSYYRPLIHFFACSSRIPSLKPKLTLAGHWPKWKRPGRRVKFCLRHGFHRDPNLHHCHRLHLRLLVASRQPEKNIPAANLSECSARTVRVITFLSSERCANILLARRPLNLRNPSLDGYPISCACPMPFY